ncbi:MAG: oligosaccharide flippase family protein [Bacteroidales bacterium]|nr:oligosaccharide flippase family protein [Bacteroidales bacterium]
MLKKLFTNTLIYGLAPQLPRILSVFTLPIVTQYLTKTDYGINGIIMSYIGAVSVFEMLGLRLSIVNSFYHSEKQHKWLWRQIHGFLSQWMFVFSILLVILLYFITPEEARENLWYIIPLLIVPRLIVGPTTMIAHSYYQLQEKPTPIAVRSVVFGVFSILLTLYTIAGLKMGYMGWFVSNAITGTLQGISYMFPLYKKLKLTPIFNYKRRLIKKSLKVTLPTIPHYYSSFLLDSSDRIVMDNINVSTENIGGYNLAYNFGNYFGTLASATGLAIGPTLRHYIKQGKEAASRKLIFIVQIAFLIISFLMCLWIKEIFFFLIQNEDLRSVYPLTVPIIMAYNYRPMYMGSTTALFYYEKTNLLWKITFTAGILNVILNIIFIPIFGVVAAAVTTFLALMYMGYAGFFLKEFKKYNNVNYHPVKWIVATFIITLTAYFLLDISILIKIAITLTILIFLAYVVFYKKDLISLPD